MSPAPPRRRRRWWLLLSLAALLGLGAWWIERQLQPQRLTALVLAQASDALALDLSFSGEPSYHLRPEPSLRLPGFKATLPGEPAVLLSADVLQISLPWSTLLDGDAALLITRVDLTVPVLDLRLLRRWQASQPATPFELPTLSQGLRISDGQLIDDGWTLQNWSLDLPTLTPAQPATLATRGRWQSASDRVDFDGQVQLDSASNTSKLTLRVSGEWQRELRLLPYRLELDGDFRIADHDWQLRADHLLLDSDSPLPDFAGQASLQQQQQVTLELDGQLPSWPADWPALPPPIGQSTSALIVRANYQGPTDGSGDLQLHLQRDDSQADAQLQWPALQTWLQSSNEALPPLQLRASSPRLEVDGVVLEGVRVQLDEAEPEPAEQ